MKPACQVVVCNLAMLEDPLALAVAIVRQIPIVAIVHRILAAAIALLTPTSPIAPPGLVVDVAPLALIPVFPPLTLIAAALAHRREIPTAIAMLL